MLGSSSPRSTNTSLLPCFLLSQCTMQVVFTTKNMRNDSHFLFPSHWVYCCFLIASYRSTLQKKESFYRKSEDYSGSEKLTFKFNSSFNRTFPSKVDCANSPDSSKSFGDTRLDVFHHHHGLLILHLAAAVMFGPSFVAKLQRLGRGKSFPWLLDSVLCIGVILHSICNSKPEFSSFFSSFSGVPIRNDTLYFMYLIAGYWCYLSGLALAPYRSFYVMAAGGGISFALRISQRRNRDKKEVTDGSRKHPHRH